MLHDVMHIHQEDSLTCWIASLLMMIHWRHGQPRGLNPQAQAFYTGMIQTEDGQAVHGSLRVTNPAFNQALRYPRLRGLAQDVGLSIHNMPENPQLDTRVFTLANLLQSGPVLYPCEPPGMRIGHVIVLRGNTTEAGQDIIHYVDPADLGPSPRFHLPYSDLIRRFPPAGGFVATW